MDFVSDRPPELVVERSADLRLQLGPSDVTVDASRVDPRFQARLDEITFEPGPTLELTGPARTIEALEQGAPLELEPIRLAPGDTGRVAARVRLGRRLLEDNVHQSADQPVQAIIPVLPVRREAGTLRKDIALVCLSPARQELLDRWALPANAQTARLTIVTTGLIPADADLGSPALLERKAAITRFVEENLRVYADVAELPPRDEGRTVPVRIAWVKDWRRYPEALGLADATLGDWEELKVRLDSEETILLEPIPGEEDEDSP
jgi:hypothetical protein